MQYGCGEELTGEPGTRFERRRKGDVESVGLESRDGNRRRPEREKIRMDYVSGRSDCKEGGTAGIARRSSRRTRCRSR